MDSIFDKFKDFLLAGGIGSRMMDDAKQEIVERLTHIHEDPLSKVQLNQLLVLCHEAPISDDFFHYYWLSTPEHPYDVTKIPGFQKAWTDASAISSIEHLQWGFYRLFTDALLCFGNVRAGLRHLRPLDMANLESFFRKRRFDTGLIKQRGPALQLKKIPKDNRYLIAEMACKSYGDTRESSGKLKEALVEALRQHLGSAGGAITIRELLKGDIVTNNYHAQQTQFMFSVDDVLDEVVKSEEQLAQKYSRIAEKFFETREAALTNTRYYLSMVGDLDVYVATSMRTRQNFRNMADACEKIFANEGLKDLHLRYFDPTLSAAKGHEDKGLIECLMVKCAKVLVYCAGEKESYGKDAEAAMALSLGKPVIFYCDQEQRRSFYRDVHPLSRLVEFETGVAVGAIVTDSLDEVSELLYRIFENKMVYELEHPKAGYLRLKETVTGSVVRLQTNDQLLSETFWNHYHNHAA